MYEKFAGNVANVLKKFLRYFGIRDCTHLHGLSRGHDRAWSRDRMRPD